MKTTSVGRRFAVIVLSLSLTACMNLREVPVTSVQPQTKTRDLKPGRRISATLTNGTVVRFRLKSVETDALTGRGGERVAFADIASLKVERINPATTTVAVVGAVAVVSFILMNAFVHDVSESLEPDK